MYRVVFFLAGGHQVTEFVTGTHVNRRIEQAIREGVSEGSLDTLLAVYPPHAILRVLVAPAKGGSGTTAVAARNVGRECVSIAKERLAA